MNRKLFLVLGISFLALMKLSGQGLVCENSEPFCTGSIYTFPAGTTGVAQPGPAYGCLSTQPCPAWYHMLIDNPGSITIYMFSTPSEDIDFICWGPFTDPYDPCVEGLTASMIVDCSYSPAPTEYCVIPNGVTGQYYILMITNFSTNPCEITFSQTAGNGSTDCTILPPPVGNNGPLCVGETLNLYAETVPNASYYWSGPGGFLSTMQNPVIPNPNSNEPTTKVTEIMNPLTGKMFPETAANWFEDRPFGVMMNNHVDARPQSGLIYADIVYEVVAEGGITRFLTFFYSNTPEKIGPVRSTREYYLVLVKELGDAMIMHDGYSPQALFAIENWPVRSLFRGGATIPSVCDGCVWRDNPRDVAYEHTEYTNGVKLRELGDSLGWEGQTTVRPWLFKDNPNKYSASSAATDITIDYWYHGDYTGAFKFDPTTNTYLRYTGVDANDQPIPQLDQETKEQVAVKNLIIQFAVESSIAGDDKSRLEYELLGSGKALVFVDGKVIDATWSKAGRDERTIFYDTAGNEMEFNRGNFWIGIVPDRNVDQVVYK